MVGGALRVMLPDVFPDVSDIAGSGVGQFDRVRHGWSRLAPRAEIRQYVRRVLHFACIDLFFSLHEYL